MMKKISMLATSILTIVLEILPYGAVCIFSDAGEKIRRTYSYFDLTPYAYANFAPFVTAILSCVVCILCVLAFWIDKKAVKKSITVMTALSAVTSVLPVFHGLSYVSITGVCITLSILVLFVLSMAKEKKNQSINR